MVPSSSPSPSPSPLTQETHVPIRAKLTSRHPNPERTSPKASPPPGPREQTSRESAYVSHPRNDRNVLGRAAENRSKLKEAGLCKDCRQPAIPGQTRCPSCAGNHRQSRRPRQSKRQDAWRLSSLLMRGDEDRFNQIRRQNYRHSVLGTLTYTSKVPYPISKHLEAN